MYWHKWLTASGMPGGVSSDLRFTLPVVWLAVISFIRNYLFLSTNTRNAGKSGEIRRNY